MDPEGRPRMSRSPSGKQGRNGGHPRQRAGPESVGRTGIPSNMGGSSVRPGQPEVRGQGSEGGVQVRRTLEAGPEKETLFYRKWREMTQATSVP